MRMGMGMGRKLCSGNFSDKHGLGGMQGGQEQPGDRISRSFSSWLGRFRKFTFFYSFFLFNVCLRTSLCLRVPAVKIHGNPLPKNVRENKFSPSRVRNDLLGAPGLFQPCRTALLNANNTRAFICCSGVFPSRVLFISCRHFFPLRNFNANNKEKMNPSRKTSLLHWVYEALKNAKCTHKKMLL